MLTNTLLRLPGALHWHSGVELVPKLSEWFYVLIVYQKDVIIICLLD